MKKNLWVWIDATDRCNLSCRDCYTKTSHSNNILTPNKFHHILEILTKNNNINLKICHLNWRGEPLMNKYFTELLDIRNNFFTNLPLQWHTNGTMITEKVAKELISKSIKEDLIYVSIDGGTRELHEKNRGINTWDKAIKGLKRLLEAKNNASSDTVTQIGIYEIFWNMKRKVDVELLELSKYVDIWTRVPAIDTNGIEPITSVSCTTDSACFWAGNSLSIAATGDVSICILSNRQDGVVGNIFQEDIEEIINRTDQFRFTLQKFGRSSIEHCSKCKKSDGEADPD